MYIYIHMYVSRYIIYVYIILYIHILYVYLYTYFFILYTHLSLSLSFYIYIHTYIYIYKHIYVLAACPCTVCLCSDALPLLMAGVGGYLCCASRNRFHLVQWFALRFFCGFGSTLPYLFHRVPCLRCTFAAFPEAQWFFSTWIVLVWGFLFQLNCQFRRRCTTRAWSSQLSGRNLAAKSCLLNGTF